MSRFEIVFKKEMGKINLGLSSLNSCVYRQAPTTACSFQLSPADHFFEGGKGESGHVCIFRLVRVVEVTNLHCAIQMFG